MDRRHPSPQRKMAYVKVPPSYPSFLVYLSRLSLWKRYEVERLKCLNSFPNLGLAVDALVVYGRIAVTQNSR